MARFFLLFSFLVLTLYSCTDSSVNGVGFGSDQVYKIDKETEESVSLTQELSDEFKELTAGIRAQIPLNKVIESGGYKVFIGIPLKAKAQKIIQGLENDTTYNFAHLKSQDIGEVNFNKMYTKKDSIFACYLAYDMEETAASYLVVFTGTDSSSIGDMYENKGFVESKIEWK